MPDADARRGIYFSVLFAALALLPVPVPAATLSDIVAEADTYINASTPTTNSGTADQFVVSAGTFECITYIRFNVTGLPANATITDARLRAVTSSAGASTVTGGTIRKYAPTTEQWSETQPTWNNQLAGEVASGNLHTLGAVAVNTAYEFTGLQSAITGNGRVTFIIHSTSDDGAKYLSKDAASNKPVLKITYTPDTTAPTVSNVSAVDITNTSARITWTTTEASTTVVDYGLTTGYGSQASNADLVTNHSITLSGLSQATQYHYRVKSVDAAGNPTNQGDLVFTTTGSATLSDITSEADTYVLASQPTSNFGTVDSMLASSGTFAGIIYLRFNVTGLPPGAAVTDARVRMTTRSDGAAESTGGTMRHIAPTTEQWSETQPTWNNQLAGTEGDALHTLGPVSASQLYEFINLHPVVTGNGRVSFTIRSTSSDGAKYYSRDHTTASQRPMLRVTYSVTHQVAAPTVSPAGGVISGATSVTLSSSTSGAQIRYTLDGSTPTKSATLYTGSFSVSAGTTVKAIGVANGKVDSPIAIASFDSAPGSFSIVSPAAGLLIEKDAVVYLQTAGGDPAKLPYEYQFSVGGVVKQAWATTAPATWTPLTADLGARTLGFEIRNTGQGYSPPQATRDVLVIRSPADRPEVQQ